MKKKYYIETFGCQMNVHDSEKMSGILKSEGYTETDSPGKADIIVFNTCSIREKAEQKFFSKLGRLKTLKKRNPQLKIAVAGCIAQQERDKIFQRTPYVDFVLGPQNIHLLTGIGNIKGHSVACDDNPMLADTDFYADRKDRVKAWVNIMYGCNNFCSYCIVPYTRGREKSRPSEMIIREIQDLAREGFKEVTLLGQNVNSYRSDCNFSALLQRVAEIRGIKRIRFVTSHPKDLSIELISAMKDLENVCEHLHLPLQSGSSRILELMNRKYDYPSYMEKVEVLREAIPNIAITTDIIAGFPQETDEDHALTIAALKEIAFDGIFAFNYSPRTGTAASELEGHIADEVKSQRLYEIIAVQNSITDRKNRDLEGTTQEILVEASAQGMERMITGRTRTNKIVNVISSDSVMAGDTINVQITKAMRHSLEGSIL